MIGADRVWRVSEKEIVRTHPLIRSRWRNLPGKMKLIRIGFAFLAGVIVTRRAEFLEFTAN